MLYCCCKRMTATDFMLCETLYTSYILLTDIIITREEDKGCHIDFVCTLTECLKDKSFIFMFSFNDIIIWKEKLNRRNFSFFDLYVVKRLDAGCGAEWGGGMENGIELYRNRICYSFPQQTEFLFLQIFSCTYLTSQLSNPPTLWLFWQYFQWMNILAGWFSVFFFPLSWVLLSFFFPTIGDAEGEQKWEEGERVIKGGCLEIKRRKLRNYQRKRVAQMMGLGGVGWNERDVEISWWGGDCILYYLGLTLLLMFQF